MVKARSSPLGNQGWQVGVLLAGLVWIVSGVIDAKEQASVSEMPKITVSVGDRDYSAHLAATPRHRAAGFQQVPSDRIVQTLLCFRYPEPRRPRFHMRNVASSLRLAWIAPDGRIRSIDHAEPNTAGYRPDAPVGSVLEIHPEHPVAGVVGEGTKIVGC
jgi:uncharacterized membrane protein (UPF0127 family)